MDGGQSYLNAVRWNDGRRKTEGRGFNLCVAPSPRTESYFGGMKMTEDGVITEDGL